MKPDLRCTIYEVIISVTFYGTFTLIAQQSKFVEDDLSLGFVFSRFVTFCQITTCFMALMSNL